MTAMGVMRESYEEKIAVPGELSVIGFDNIRLSQYVLPPLRSTCRNPNWLASRFRHS
jgi:LacI family transcriptional regulator, galactose operon repressor